MAHRNGRAGIGVHGGVVSEHWWGHKRSLLKKFWTQIFADNRRYNNIFFFAEYPELATWISSFC